MAVVKKWGAFWMVGFMPALVFWMTLLSSGFIIAMLALFMTIPIMALLGSIMISHPLRKLIEGKGMLTMTWDSTGVIETFNVNADPPFVRGIFNKKTRETMFDREIVNYLLPPQDGKLVEATMINAQGKAVGKRKVLLMPTNEEKPDYLFSFGSYPTFIYNKNLGNFLQKSLLSDFETNTFVKHMVLHLLKKTEELSIHVRDFARYVVEATRPKKKFWDTSNIWFWVILGIAILVIAALIGPMVLQAFSGISSGGGGGPANLP